MRRLASPAAAVIACVVAGAVARAEPPAPPAAAAPATGAGAVYRRQGREYFDEGRYDAAILEFRKAYELEADPTVLFDIGLAYQELGSGERARFFYRRYLSALPDAPNRVAVEERIAALDRVLPPAPPSSAFTPLAPPSPELAATPGPEAPRPLWKRWWFWTAVGVLATGTAVTVVALRRRESDTPHTSLGGATFFE